ncbi:MAG: ATP-binding protein [bacterium]|nr:ATP-binding protein [bacterium]
MKKNDLGSRELIHQFSTPLTNCLYLLEGYLEKTFSPAEELLLAKGELEKVFALLNNRQAKNLSNTNFSPATVIQKIIHNYRKPYSLRLYFQNWPQKIICRGRADIFEQIILHLLNNADESYPPLCTQKEISITLIKASSGLNLIIGDNGQGLSWWKKLIIRGKNISFKKVKSGLGLYQVAKLLKKEFNGKLTFLSEKNRGTLVIVHFPL